MGREPTSYNWSEYLPILAIENSSYYGVIPSINAVPHRRISMMRLFPLTWVALHVGLASVATWLLVSTDVLTDAAFFLIH